MGALLSQVKEKPELLPPRIIIHGEGGVGKTSLMASIPGIIAIPAEEGSGNLSFPAFPSPTSLADVMDAIRELHSEEHSYRALGIDTIDQVEPLVWQATCEEQSNDKRTYNNIEDFGYAKGYLYADRFWTEFFQALDALRRDRKMTVVICAHSERKSIADPQLGPYDKLEPKLHKRANALMYEWADVVGYLDVERASVEKGESRKVRTASATGQRVLLLEDTGAFRAKNRYRLPPYLEIPHDNPYGPLRNAIAKALGLTKEAA